MQSGTRDCGGMLACKLSLCLGLEKAEDVNYGCGTYRTEEICNQDVERAPVPIESRPETTTVEGAYRLVFGI